MCDIVRKIECFPDPFGIFFVPNRSETLLDEDGSSLKNYMPEIDTPKRVFLSQFVSKKPVHVDTLRRIIIFTEFQKTLRRHNVK